MFRLSKRTRPLITVGGQRRFDGVDLVPLSWIHAGEVFGFGSTYFLALQGEKYMDLRSGAIVAFSDDSCVCQKVGSTCRPFFGKGRKARLKNAPVASVVHYAGRPYLLGEDGDERLLISIHRGNWRRISIEEMRYKCTVTPAKWELRFF